MMPPQPPQSFSISLTFSAAHIYKIAASRDIYADSAAFSQRASPLSRQLLIFSAD